MRAWTLLFLRVSVGWLLVIWGADKLANVSHGLRVSDGFYFGIFSQPLLLRGFGVGEIALGLLVMLGVVRRRTYPFLLAITGATALAVWRSILDPWGWVLEPTNALFYPSLIILAAVLVLWAFRADDRFVIEPKPRRQTSPRLTRPAS